MQHLLVTLVVLATSIPLMIRFPTLSLRTVWVPLLVLVGPLVSPMFLVPLWLLAPIRVPMMISLLT